MGALGEVAVGRRGRKSSGRGKHWGEAGGRGAARPPQAGPRAKLVAFGGAERGCAPTPCPNERPVKRFCQQYITAHAKNREEPAQNITSPAVFRPGAAHTAARLRCRLVMGMGRAKAFAGFPLAFLCCCTKKDTRSGVFFMELMIRFELTTSSLPRTRSTY